MARGHSHRTPIIGLHPGVCNTIVCIFYLTTIVFSEYAWRAMYTGHVIEDLIELAEAAAKRTTRQEPPKRPESAPVQPDGGSERE
jgi:hypothetical protein